MRRAAADPNFWSHARDVLNVVSASEMPAEAFDSLQRQLSGRLQHPVSGVPSLAISEPAMLASGHKHKTARAGFSKFCAAESLLALMHQQRQKAIHGTGSPLEIGLNCTVRRIVLDGEDITGLETSRGHISLNGGRTKLVLCAGVITGICLS